MGKDLFAKRMDNIKASEIRELLKITENPEIISFAGGLPAPEFFPLAEMAAISSILIKEFGVKALQYSTTEGYTPLRQKIAARMNRIFKTAVHEDEIIITSGSQQALDFVGKLFINEGDIVLCESPSYLGAINAFRAYGPEFKEVPTDGEGMIPEELERILVCSPVAKFIYCIPNFQNPTGRTWSGGRRKALLQIAEKHGLIVVEDNPYGELSFEGEIQPAIKSMDTTDSVIYLGTFSKTLCPGMRIGWIAAGGKFIEKFGLIKQGADLHTSTISQMEIDKFMDECDFDGHVEHLREVYKKRRDVMLRAMDAEFPSSIKYNRPKGGLFTWVEMPEGIDSRELLRKSLEKGVAFVPGGSFFPCVAKENTFRVNYSNMPEERIVTGVQRLSRILRDYL